MAEANVSSNSLTKAIGDVVRYHKRTICDSCETELNYPYRGEGKGLIFVNKVFEGQQTRHGAEKDLEFLEGIYAKYNVKTDSYLDFKEGKEGTEGDDINMKVVRKIKEFVTEIKRKDCSVIFVSFATHGGTEGKLIMPDKSKLSVEEIVEKFMVDKLCGIPKVFIFQACRGDKKETQIAEGDGVAEDEDPPVYATQRSDIIMVYSTYEGYYSFRGDKGEGSWFLQVLYSCVTLPAYQNLHFIEILTVCSSLIIDNFRTKDKNNTKSVTQTPGYYSTLRKFLRFPSLIQMK